MTVIPGLPALFGVVGAGQMGAGIAQVAASSGLQVCLVDPKEKNLSRAVKAIQVSLERLASKGKIEGDPKDVMRRIQTSTQMQALETAEYVLETVPEKEELKLQVFRVLDEVTPGHAILASNTSSISITRLAAATRRPHQVVGLHFMNPAPVMGLVELVRGMQTSDEAFEASQRLIAHLGKTTGVSIDRPGFIINRILLPMINEAFCVLMEGVGSAADIDASLHLGTNHPMGPLKLADFIGLDTCLAILETMHRSLGDKYRPCQLLRQYVQAGWLGKKAGRGVYAY